MAGGVIAFSCSGSDPGVESENTATGGNGGAGGDECEEPLSAWCGGSDDPCVTWAEVKDDFDASGPSCDNDEGIERRYGSCGDHWFAEVDDEFGGQSYYFDSAGDLVGLHTSTDVNTYCDDSFSATFGTIPTCEKVEDYNSCSSGEGGAGGAR